MTLIKNIHRISVVVCCLICAICTNTVFAQTANTNYLRTRVPQIPVRDSAKLDTIPIQRQAINVEYSDALGRTLQTVQVQGSPTLKDVIVPFEYDIMGRAVKMYLPYADQATNSSTAGTLRSNAAVNAVNFYNPSSPGATKMATDASPYTQGIYEKSPMGRVLEQGEPGSVFQPGGGHTVRAAYNINSAADGINYYNVSEGVSVTTTAFGAGVLTKTIVTDQSGHRTVLWKDLQGRPVTHTQLDAPTAYYSTDYVYNDLGQLSDIITPLTKKNLSLTNLNQTGYIFHYDSLGRVVEKKIPGKGWVYMIYNHSDLPVLTQDSNQRTKSQWMYMKYDAEGRIVQTGIYTNVATLGRRIMQTYCDNNSAALWETWQPSTGYTNNAFPQQNAMPGVAPLAVYTIYYYDDYSFAEATAKPFQSNVYSTVPTMRTMGMLTGVSVYVLGTANQRLVTVNYYDNRNHLIQQIGDNHLGQVDVVNNQYNYLGELTGSNRQTTPIAGNTVTVKDRYVYDHIGRLLDTWESLQGAAEIDISHNVYNELSQEVSEGLNVIGNLTPGAPRATAAVITENTALTASKTDIAGNRVVLSNGFSFTAGPGKSYQAQIGAGYAQMVEYRYNIKGDPTSINNGTLTYDGGITQSDSTALFGESITYHESSPINATPQYNGNIAGITWRNKIEQTGYTGLTTGGQGYAFTYDNVNRLTQNSYYTQSGTNAFAQNTTGALTENIGGYDEQGNILSLQRKDKNGSLLNNMSYTYLAASNTLSSISDVGAQHISGSFSYDGNGNMITDTRKGITLTYNYLDLIDTVKQGGNKLVFTYDAAGNKLYKQVINSSGVITSQRHYVEDLEVTASSSIAYDGKIESIAMDAGRIVNTGANTYQYEYYLQDHLSNNRVSFRVNTDGTLNLTQVQNYYPFGGDMGDGTMNYSASPQNQYKYNSKELQPELNLKTYDFGARHYDPVIGRWTAVDPLADEYEELSPYNYVENNPINLIDPDGMGPGPNGTWSGVPYGKWGPAGSAGDFITGGISIAISGYSAFNAYSWHVKPPKNINLSLGSVQRDNTKPAQLPAPKIYKASATLRQWKPGLADRWKNAGWLGKTSYGMFDDGYLTMQALFSPNVKSHLNNEIASPHDLVNGFGSTFALAIPMGKGGAVAKEIVETVAEDGIVDFVEQSVEKETSNFTKSNFRANLIKKTGVNPGASSQAHHILPQKFESFFNSKGINIHDPQFGAWWEKINHLENAYNYNKAWEEFIRTNPSKSQIIKFGEQLMKKHL